MNIDVNVMKKFQLQKSRKSVAEVQETLSIPNAN
jgi:hypothetical protein